MNIDWTVAIGAFLLFVLWAFAFYGQMFTHVGNAVPLETVADTVLDNLTITVHSVPVRANISNVSVSNAVLYMEYRWPFGKNTTSVLKDGVSQACNITGNTLYWKSNMAAEANEFTMTYSEQHVPLRCTGGFSVVNETQVIPFAAQEESRLSNASMAEMNATNYTIFKAQLGISGNFNVKVTRNADVLMDYGPRPPQATNVFSTTVNSVLEETGEHVNVRFLVW